MGIHGNLLFPLHEHLSDDVNLHWKGLFVNLKIKSRGKCLAATLKVRITSLCWMSSHASAGEWLQSAQRASITGSVMDGGAAGHPATGGSARTFSNTSTHFQTLCSPQVAHVHFATAVTTNLGRRASGSPAQTAPCAEPRTVTLRRANNKLQPQPDAEDHFH